MIVPEPVLAVAREVAAAGGRALVVGGAVRDHLLGLQAKDLDVEVHGLALDELERVLRAHGEVIAVGRSFGVLKLAGLEIDFALPRLETKVASGHKGFDIRVNPALTFAEAARRRDLTINAIGLDPLSGEILDPHGGQADLRARILRATDVRTFAEDPLRALRVAQLAARFDMHPDAELRRLCAGLDLSELSAERILGELDKLLLKAARPSVGLASLQQTGLLRVFPELAALVGVPQDPRWHPEGDVWTHTLMVVDEAARLRQGDAQDLVLMLAALTHDLGKAVTTAVDADRIRSPAHEPEGARLARIFLERLRAPGEVVAAVAVLVEHHLAPTLLMDQQASDRAFRRLARALAEGGVTTTLLERLCRADHLGRTTPEALARQYPEGEAFLQRVAALAVADAAPADVVLGRHVLARGIPPGPGVGEILRRCRELQDETGSQDPEALLDRVLGSRRS